MHAPSNPISFSIRRVLVEEMSEYQETFSFDDVTLQPLLEDQKSEASISLCMYELQVSESE